MNIAMIEYPQNTAIRNNHPAGTRRPVGIPYGPVFVEMSQTIKGSK